jgi:hypothetical protein
MTGTILLPKPSNLIRCQVLIVVARCISNVVGVEGYVRVCWGRDKYTSYQGLIQGGINPEKGEQNSQIDIKD